MAKIAIDLDDTLYPFCDLARKIMSEEGLRTSDDRLIAASYAPWVEWRSPPDLAGLDQWLDIIALCHDNNMIANQTPYDGAVETLQELVESGNELMYISNRATETKRATHQWLAIQGFPAGELVVTSSPKKPFLTNCKYLIDDRPKTMIEFLHDHEWYNRNMPDRKVFSLTKEFNRGLTDVPGIYLAPTWYGVRHYLIQHGLIRIPVAA